MEKPEKADIVSSENEISTPKKTPSGNTDNPGTLEKCVDLQKDPEKKNCSPEVFVATWLPKDHVLEFARILQGAPADEVQDRLLLYVVETIEPAGWRAVWRASLQTAKELGVQRCLDFIVDVIHVSQEKLFADVKVFEAVRKEPSEKDESLEELKNKEISVPLMELYPLTIQENHAVDIATTAEVVEQIRFFYNHIWQAWDMEEENFCYDRYLIVSRLKLYQDIETGKIPSTIGTELRSIIRKGRDVQNEIERIEGDDVDSDMDQSEVMSLIQLHKQMEKLKSRFELLQQPVLRELSNHYPPIERCWSVSGCKGSLSKVKIVVDCLSLGELGQLSQLPDLLKSLPEVQNDTACQSFPTLQLALDTAVPGDVVVVLPGSHILQHIGLISTRGALIGLGENIIIEGTKDAGDVLIDVSGDFILQNVTLRPTAQQIAMVHHEGTLQLKKVVIEGGLSGVVGLGKSNTVIKDVKIQDCTDKGVDFREGAIAFIKNSHFAECGIGMHLEEDSKISVVGSTFNKNCRHGILITCPETSDVSSFKGIPKEGLLKSFILEYEGNSLDENKEDVCIQTDVKSRGHENTAFTDLGKHAALHGSTGSLDSGLEFVEYTKTNE
ncbi:hypothetical protein SK128_026172 [Halocaridina rubra]|uniref:SHC SH2 domain-binding protein 1 n=1 Tax=Halocaridina rubra TaxID=373956 RepID=A0AAN8WEQ7_HALRR